MNGKLHIGLDYTAGGIRTTSFQLLNEEGKSIATVNCDRHYDGTSFTRFFHVPIATAKERGTFQMEFFDKCEQWLKDNPNCATNF